MFVHKYIFVFKYQINIRDMYSRMLIRFLLPAQVNLFVESINCTKPHSVLELSLKYYGCSRM